jgi:hypothetical protein
MRKATTPEVWRRYRGAARAANALALSALLLLGGGCARGGKEKHRRKQHGQAARGVFGAHVAR